MITRRFIETIHSYFDELNYHPKEFNTDDYSDAVAKTIIHSKTLEDAKIAILIAQYCDKKMNKIIKMFQKKKHIYDEYIYEGNSALSLLSDEDSLGNYYITNGISNNVKDIYIAGNFDDKECFYAIDYKYGEFFIYEDSYFIKYANMSYKKMKLFNKDNKCLCNIVINDDLDIELEKNLSPYELVEYEDCIAVYDKVYYDSKRNKNDLNLKESIAFIEWDILTEKSKYGVAKITLLKSLEIDNFEIVSLLAASTFILFQRYMDNLKSSKIIMTAATLGAANSVRLNNNRMNNFRRFK